MVRLLLTVVVGLRFTFLSMEKSLLIQHRNQGNGKMREESVKTSIKVGLVVATLVVAFAAALSGCSSFKHYNTAYNTTIFDGPDNYPKN